MKKELSLEEEITIAIEDVKVAMLANLKASKLELEAKVEKEKCHYNLLKAKERLNGLERSI